MLAEYDNLISWAGVWQGCMREPLHPTTFQSTQSLSPWKGTTCLSCHQPHTPQLPSTHIDVAPEPHNSHDHGVGIEAAASEFVPPLTSTCSFLLQSGKDKDAIDKVFKNLDENGDSQVDFKEFVIFVAALTCCCHKYFEQKTAK